VAARGGRPNDESLVLPATGGELSQLHDWQNWRRRVFAPAAAAVGLARTLAVRPAPSFASLLLHEGRNSVVEIAAQLGHSPTRTLDTYGHVIDELVDAEKVSAEEEIRRARAKIRPISGPRAEDPRLDGRARARKRPRYAGPLRVGDPGLEPGSLLAVRLTVSNCVRVQRV
jgi:hypothetical protein